jgi:hypothetical protein
VSALPPAAVPRIVTTAASEEPSSKPSEQSYYNSDSSGTTTPDERGPGYVAISGGCPFWERCPCNEDGCCCCRICVYNSGLTTWAMRYQTGAVSFQAPVSE